MNHILNDPLGILRAPSKTTAQLKSGGPVTARLDNVDLGICPIGQCPMQSSMARDIPVYICLTHHICLPKANA